jgi:hypothetical protein
VSFTLWKTAFDTMDYTTATWLISQEKYINDIVKVVGLNDDITKTTSSPENGDFLEVSHLASDDFS